MITSILLMIPTLFVQVDELACGPAALYFGARSLGIFASPAEVRAACGDAKSHTIHEVATAANALGLDSEVVVLNPWDGPFPVDPLIAWLDRPAAGHFVLIARSTDGNWKLWDQTEVPRLVSPQWLARRWPGPAVRLLLKGAGSAPFTRVVFGMEWVCCAVAVMIILLCCVPRRAFRVGNEPCQESRP